MIEDYIEYYSTRRYQGKPVILTPFDKHGQYLAAVKNCHQTEI